MRGLLDEFRDFLHTKLVHREGGTPGPGQGIAVSVVKVEPEMTDAKINFTMLETLGLWMK